MKKTNAVQVLLQNFNHDYGYDLVVTDGSATVQDYLDALNYAIEKYTLTRSRKKVASCQGCELCCAERAPLTAIDLSNIKDYLKVGGESLQKTLDRISYIVVNGPAVDITLRRGEDERCIFLDRKEKLCSIYPARPLVCQTFICCPSSAKAVRLRELVVNFGEDELVRQWLAQASEKGESPGFHEGFRPKINIKDWKPNVFSAKSNYKEVKLKEICPPSLWKQLYKNC
ncbi:YkgJ family cysteine cluster protein [Desulfotruncus alcoholivorax]|uniref:YkgJ family cysteine cluster protein n=1 Tax=Desulfotruncus alcoholivorax TaxID=265477 RepID=UPI0003FBA5F3|nr:YkgJ family cysteine cluster protein [Desulfotruncus alcoholivorax]